MRGIDVDPVEGTELVANGLNGAMAVVAIAPAGQLLNAPDLYMHVMKQHKRNLP